MTQVAYLDILRLSVGIENETTTEEMMNRSVTALTYYPQLFAEISGYLDDGESFVYLVTDDGFAGEAQIWTESNRDEILAQYAKDDHRATIEEMRESFDSSREIFHIDRADLTAARAALAE